MDDGPYRRHIERQYDWIVLNSLAENHQNEKAIKLASGMLEQEGRLHEKAHLFQLRATVYGAGGQCEKAVADFTEAIRLDPNNPALYAGRGLAYDGMREYEKAIANFTVAIRLASQNAPFGPTIPCATLIEPWPIRGKGDCDKAVADCTEAIRLNPKNAHACDHPWYIYSSNREHNKCHTDTKGHPVRSE